MLRKEIDLIRANIKLKTSHDLKQKDLFDVVNYLRANEGREAHDSFVYNLEGYELWFKAYEDCTFQSYYRDDFDDGAFSGWNPIYHGSIKN